MFTKITRRYLDTLPFGWAPYDVLFHLLPTAALVLTAVGISTRDGFNARSVLMGVLVSVITVVVIRVWSSDYL